MQEQHPDAFAEVVAVDRELCALLRFRKLAPGVAFLHRSRRPPDEVNLAAARDADEVMQHEYEGPYGI